MQAHAHFSLNFIKNAQKSCICQKLFVILHRDLECSMHTRTNFVNQMFNFTPPICAKGGRINKNKYSQRNRRCIAFVAMRRLFVYNNKTN